MNVSTQSIQALAADETSLPSRLRYTALLLVAIGGACVAGALWATEPSLPVRTQAALAVLVAINLSWVTFSIWVLTHRRILLARHSVVAGWMAVAFCAVFVTGAWAVGYWGGLGRSMYLAAVLGMVMLAVAAALLTRARQRFERLVQRRRELEQVVRGGAALKPGDVA